MCVARSSDHNHPWSEHKRTRYFPSPTFWIWYFWRHLHMDSCCWTMSWIFTASIVARISCTMHHCQIYQHHHQHGTSCQWTSCVKTQKVTTQLHVLIAPHSTKMRSLIDVCLTWSSSLVHLVYITIITMVTRWIFIIIVQVYYKDCSIFVVFFCCVLFMFSVHLSVTPQ